MLKKVFSIVLILFLSWGWALPAFAQYNVQPVFSPSKPIKGSDKKYFIHGHAEINEGEKYDSKLFTGETAKVKKGTTVKMSVSSVLNSGYTDEGDEFFAQISSDISNENGIIIPARSVAHGTVSALSDGKKFGRDGYVVLDFDYILTPDGRKIPIEAKMTTKANPVKATAKHVARDVGYMLGGGALGGWMALNMLGAPAAVATEGLSVAGGAAIGAGMGLGVAVSKKGKDVLITPGDEIKVKIKATMELPVLRSEVFKDEEIHYDGLNIKIANYKIDKDPFGKPNTITLSVLVDNQTKKTFSSFDMALISDLKNVYYPTPFANTNFWFNKVYPKDRTSMKLSFAVANPKRKHWLIIYDTYSYKPLIKISVDNAKRNIFKKKSKKKR